jgi:predicted phage terminase large subunit-like protein
MIPTYDQVAQELGRRSYEEYVEYVHKNNFIRSKFSSFITNTIQEFIETPTERSYEILCLSVPSQHGKSMTVTETLPSWLIGRYPKARIIIASYNEYFAGKFLRRNRSKIREFGVPMFKFDITKDSAEEIEFTSGGSIMSKGLMGGITGNPAEFFIIDDPIKNRQEAESPTIRETLHEEWLSSVKTRLAPHAKIIVIQTRWHKQDLIGYILETEKNVRYISLPVECLQESDEMGRVYGEMLVAEIGRDRAWWDDFKISYQTAKGSRALNSIYYCNPTNDEGGIFQRAWFKLYTFDKNANKKRYDAFAPDVFRHIVIGVDATFKDTKKSDFVAIQVWAKTNNKNYLLHKVKERMTFTKTLEKLTGIIDNYPNYNAILVEDKANGSAIIDVLSRRYRAVIAVEPYGSKEARASAIAPMLEAGDVYILDTHGSLIEEAVEFPNSENDDEVDAMSMCLNRLREVVANDPKPKLEMDYDDELEAVMSY